MDPDKVADYWPQRQENDEFIKKNSRRFARKIAANSLAEDGELTVERWLNGMGYLVEATGPNHPHDRNVTDPKTGITIRVEVETSLYYGNKRSGRYQARIHHFEADVVVFVARNGQDWPFVIPMADVFPRRNVSIWSQCPANYTGIWRQYMNAWDNLEAAFELAARTEGINQ